MRGAICSSLPADEREVREISALSLFNPDGLIIPMQMEYGYFDNLL